MKIEYLLEFAVFAEYLNFTKAAKALYMTQSALSKHMAALERELGCKLINRDADEVSLSKMGAVILEDVVRVKYEYQNLLSHVSALKSAENMSLRLMVFDTYRPMNDVIATAYRNLVSTHPLFTLDQVQVKYRSPIEDVRSGEADMCYTSYAPGTPTEGLSTECLYEEPVYAVVRRCHPLAKRKVISVRELDGEFWHYPAAPAFADSYGLIKGLLESHGIRMRVIPEPWMTTSDFFNFSFNDGVFIGSAAAIMQDSPATSRLGYSALRFEEPDIFVHSNLIWRAGDANPAIPVFVEEARRVVESIDIATYWTFD